MSGSLSRSLLVAPVGGLAAAALVPILEERMAKVELLAAAGRVDVADLAEVREVFAAIRQAGRAYVDWLASDCGKAEVDVAVTAQRSMGEISSDEAAEMLGVSARRVRQLCAAGVLAGRKVAGVWVVDRASLLSYRDVRSAA